jgi:hypothetical protein
MGKLLGWLLTGGATAILSTASEIGKPLSEAYATKQKSLIDTHKIDTEAATQVTIADYATGLQVNQLQATLALEDSKHTITAWMRPSAFSVSLFVFILVVIGAKLPKLAGLIGVSNADLPGYWSYLPILIISAVVVLRPWEKNKSAQNIATMQANIAKSLPITSSSFFNRQ